MSARILGTVALTVVLLAGCEPAGLADVRLRVDGVHVSRIDHAFGTVAPAARHEQSVELVNAGTASARITGLATLVSSPEDAIRIEASFPFDLGPGEVRSLQLVFEPPRTEAAYSAGFRVLLEGSVRNGPDIFATGRTGALACALEVDPPSLDFGVAAADETSSRTLRIRNTQSVPGADCEVEVRTAPGGDPRFGVEDVGTKRLGPGESLEVAVSVTPGHPALPSASTTVQITADGAAWASVPVTATFATCLEVTSSFDFGAVNVCEYEVTRTLKVRNSCAVDVTVDGAVVTITDAIGVGHPRCPGPEVCPRFKVGASAAFPIGVPSGGEAQLPIAYDPLVEGDAVGEVTLEFRAGLQPLTTPVGLLGNAYYPGVLRTDRWETGMKDYADLLVVMDDGPGMYARKTQLNTSIHSFASRIGSVCRDVNVAVITADTLSSSTPGRFIQPAGEDAVLNNRTSASFGAQLKARLSPATATSNASATPLEAARLALTPPLIDQENAGFLRPDTDLWVVIVTDRSDASPLTVADYLQAFSAVTPNASTPPRVFAVGGFGWKSGCTVPADDGRLEEATRDSGGSTDNLCDTTWYFSEMYGNCMPWGTWFELSERVIPGTAVEVTIDGISVPEKAADGTVLWRYDVESKAIAFTTPPGENRRIEATYPQAACGL